MAILLSQLLRFSILLLLSAIYNLTVISVARFFLPEARVNVALHINARLYANAIDQRAPTYLLVRSDQTRMRGMQTIVTPSRGKIKFIEEINRYQLD